MKKLVRKGKKMCLQTDLEFQQNEIKNTMLKCLAQG